MLRHLVRGLATVCGYAAAFFLAAIAVATLTQIVARQMGIAIETTELSGFFLAASTFLGLAYTFINGGHVRITVFASIAAPGAKRAVELWCCLVAIVITGYAAWHMGLFALETYRYGDLTPGLLALPLWLPQAGLAFGLAVLCLAIVEQATLIWAGKPAGYEANIDSTAEST